MYCTVCLIGVSYVKAVFLAIDSGNGCGEVSAERTENGLKKMIIIRIGLAR